MHFSFYIYNTLVGTFSPDKTHDALGFKVMDVSKNWSDQYFWDELFICAAASPESILIGKKYL